MRPWPSCEPLRHRDGLAVCGAWPRLGVAGIAALLLAGATAAAWIPALAWPFRVACHQLPERSTIWEGLRFAVCARCFGLYVGVLGAAMLPVRAGGRWVTLAFAATAMDAVFGFSGNVSRAALGAALGAAATGWMLRGRR